MANIERSEVKVRPDRLFKQAKIPLSPNITIDYTSHPATSIVTKEIKKEDLKH